MYTKISLYKQYESHNLKDFNLLGTLGTNDALNFNWPYYTCIDDMGRVAVSDSHNRCVKLFDKNLNFISCFGKDVFTCCAGVTFSHANGGYIKLFTSDQYK